MYPKSGQVWRRTVKGDHYLLLTDPFQHFTGVILIWVLGPSGKWKRSLDWLHKYCELVDG